jgi:hypothetical protein
MLGIHPLMQHPSEHWIIEESIARGLAQRSILRCCHNPTLLPIIAELVS